MLFWDVKERKIIQMPVGQKFIIFFQSWTESKGCGVIGQSHLLGKNWFVQLRNATWPLCLLSGDPQQKARLNSRILSREKDEKVRRSEAASPVVLERAAEENFSAFCYLLVKSHLDHNARWKLSQITNQPLAFVRSSQSFGWKRNETIDTNHKSWLSSAFSK